MTRTTIQSPAKPSRRTLIATAATAGATAAIAPAAAIAAPAPLQDDAVRIIDLCDQRRDLQRQADEIATRCLVTAAAAENVPPPPTLLRRRADARVVLPMPHLGQEPGLGEPYAERHVEYLRNQPVERCLTEWMDRDDGSIEYVSSSIVPFPLGQRRADAIVAAWDAWRTEVEAAKAEVFEMEAELEATLDQRDAITDKLILDGAKSLAGVIAIARLVGDIMARDEFNPEDDNVDIECLSRTVVKDIAALAAVAA
jgi:hypothetical protein